MILSVIIVHYRVPEFLELCLLSLESTLRGLDAEILVIDNHSTDLSPQALRRRFPAVNWIFNTENLGFSRANNQGLALATGEYLLFLNPDTILPEDFAASCLAFYHQASGPPAITTGTSPKAAPATRDPRSGLPVGALGVRMIDGSGRFLKESRRGFPTAWVAFCRLSGLARLFPRSRWFSEYYLGYMPSDRPHPAPVLSGACFWVPRIALDAAGPFDEDFFMYGEDIDLSYRIEKAGYRNYYLAGTTIIHFKGASTRKDARYVRQFNKAMRQFSRKHFNRGIPGVYRAWVELAIRIRGAIFATARSIGPGRECRIGVGRPSRDASSNPSSRRIWVTGDPETVRKVRDQLPPDRPVSTDPGLATEIIFCQGPSFSFKDLIAATEKIGRGVRAGFCAAGATAVISSPNRDDRADMLHLQGEFPDKPL